MAQGTGCASCSCQQVLGQPAGYVQCYYNCANGTYVQVTGYFSCSGCAGACS